MCFGKKKSAPPPPPAPAPPPPTPIAENVLSYSDFETGNFDSVKVESPGEPGTPAKVGEVATSPNTGLVIPT